MPWSLVGRVSYREEFCSTLSQGLDKVIMQAGSMIALLKCLITYLSVLLVWFILWLDLFAWVGLCNTGWAGFEWFEGQLQ